MMDNVVNSGRVERSKFKYRLIDMEPFRSKAIPLTKEDFIGFCFDSVDHSGATAIFTLIRPASIGHRHINVTSRQLERMAAAIRIYEKVAS